MTNLDAQDYLEDNEKKKLLLIYLKKNKTQGINRCK